MLWNLCFSAYGRPEVYDEVTGKTFGRENYFQIPVPKRGVGD